MNHASRRIHPFDDDVGNGTVDENRAVACEGDDRASRAVVTRIVRRQARTGAMSLPKLQRPLVDGEAAGEAVVATEVERARAIEHEAAAGAIDACTPPPAG